MKKIEAVIRPDMLDILKGRLEKTGHPGMMITEIRGHGKQGGVVRQHRGTEYKISFLPKVKVEIVVKDSDVKMIVESIIEVCRSGNVGDGKIFISPVENVVRIRTGESGEIAVD